MHVGSRGRWPASLGTMRRGSDAKNGGAAEMRGRERARACLVLLREHEGRSRSEPEGKRKRSHLVDLRDILAGSRRGAREKRCIGTGSGAVVVRAPSLACGRRASPRSACRCEQQTAIADSTAEWRPSSSQKTSIGATRAIAPKWRSAIRAQTRAHPLRRIVLTPVIASRIWHTLSQLSKRWSWGSPFRAERASNRQARWSRPPFCGA